MLAQTNQSSKDAATFCEHSVNYLRICSTNSDSVGDKSSIIHPWIMHVKATTTCDQIIKYTIRLEQFLAACSFCNAKFVADILVLMFLKLSSFKMLSKLEMKESFFKFSSSQIFQLNLIREVLSQMQVIPRILPMANLLTEGNTQCTLSNLKPPSSRSVPPLILHKVWSTLISNLEEVWTTLEDLLLISFSISWLNICHFTVHLHSRIIIQNLCHNVHRITWLFEFFHASLHFSKYKILLETWFIWTPMSFRIYNLFVRRRAATFMHIHYILKKKKPKQLRGYTRLLKKGAYMK